MTRTEAIQLLIAIAREFAGKTESSPNMAPWIAPLWPDTSYPEGMRDRAPYCAAGMCHVVAEWIRRLAAMGQLKAILGMTLKEANAWRCKSARAFAWRDWAKAKGLKIIGDTGTPAPGDIVVFDFSHIGLVTGEERRATVPTFEFNTNASGSRDGDGAWDKQRPKSVAQCFIRLF